VRKKSAMAWKIIWMIKILQWKYRRKSTKGKNIYILGRFHGRINNPLSKGEDKSKRKELNKNEETLFTVLFMGTVHPSSPEVLFTRENTIHLGTIHPRRHISPGHLHWVLFTRAFH
jgi:hypothetical protein